MNVYISQQRREIVERIIYDEGPWSETSCMYKKLTTLINDSLNYLPSLLNNVNVVMSLYSISVYKYKYT